PAWHQRGRVHDIGEVGVAERDQTQAVERSRDAHAPVAHRDAELLPVPVCRERRMENPGASHHNHRLTDAPGALYDGRYEERAEARATGRGQWWASVRGGLPSAGTRAVSPT